MCGDSLPHERRCCTAPDDDEFVDGLGCTNLVGHVRRGKEPLGGDIEAARVGWCAGCKVEKVQRVRPPLGRALLEQPEAWDVLEEAVAAESTALVGEIRSSRAVGDVGRST